MIGIYGILYLHLGYLCFHIWLKISPPKKGRFEWPNNVNEAGSGWYVPAVLNTKPPFRSNWPRGLSVRKVLIISTLLWPFVLLVCGVRSLLDRIINHHLPKELDSEMVDPVQVSQRHQDALVELDKYLQETQ